MNNERIWILLGKKISGEITESELIELEQLLKEYPEIGLSREAIAALWQAPLKILRDEKEEENMIWRKVERKIAVKQLPGNKKNIILLKWIGIAAGLALLVSASFWIFNQPAKQSKNITEFSNARLNHIATRQKAKSKIELPEGTQVWLNENTQLQYDSKDFGVHNREVTLTGEAFFDVTKNEKIPFIIHAGIINITVKGTAFNVKAYPHDKTVETDLIRGKIEVSFPEHPDRKIELMPNQKIIIPVNDIINDEKTNSAGKQFVINSLKKNESGNVPEIAWMQDKLVFDDEPFGELSKKMEDWYGIKIYFENEKLKQLKFSGVIDKETIEEALKAMQLSRHFNFTVNEKKVFINQ